MKKIYFFGAAIAFGGLLLFAALGLAAWYFFDTVPAQQEKANVRASQEAFPTVADAGLDDSQRRIITVLRQEYEAQPLGRKYTEGAREYWCADFVSWIMKEAGQPLEGNTSAWRIDDVPPLIAYYQQQNRFIPAAEYRDPQVGDVLLHQEPSAFGNHTHIVVTVDGDTVTTIGGNEGNIIRQTTFKLADATGLYGAGTLTSRN